MSPDEIFLERLLGAVEEAGLEALVVGSTAAALQGVPVMTLDVDLLVRDTPKNREKVGRLCATLGAAKPAQGSPLSSPVTLVGLPVPVHLLFDRIPPGLSFETLGSRCARVPVGRRVALVASLPDVIASKEATGRPKDLAQLPILRETLRVKRAEEDPGA
jgi:hypothetical protein